MSIFTGIMVFVILWWVVFFTMLPIGVKTAEEAGEEVGEGHATSAPIRPRVWRKALWATLITVVLFGAYIAIESSGMVSLRPEFQRPLS